MEGRVFVDGEFTFKLTETKKSLPAYEETVTNKATVKLHLANLPSTKLVLIITQSLKFQGSDTNVDYDAMTVTMTVTVTEKMLMVI